MTTPTDAELKSYIVALVEKCESAYESIAPVAWSDDFDFEYELADHKCAVLSKAKEHLLALYLAL